MPKQRIETQRIKPRKKIENLDSERMGSESKGSEPEAGRPYMPGYGLPGATKGKGLLAWKWAEERLTSSHNYWIATTGPRGPHVMVVWGIWAGAAFYFSTGRESRKAKNLA
ncbi:MAG: pyridoxamine 5'-phosphate oxidase family protein, partial [Verrucomicrobiales bacterium]|nr:pyridoxamine 5'-phosphate oxidase family protein [Verrucomicrobiales bacterium]